MPQLTVGIAVAKAAQLLQDAGVPADQAEVTARCIVASDRWGIGSHGLMRLPFYLSRLKAGGINPTAQLKTVTDLPSLVVFDGDDGLGHWQLQKAAEIASERALVNGVAAVGVGRSNHCGALGIYVWPMINRGLVGIAFNKLFLVNRYRDVLHPFEQNHGSNELVLDLNCALISLSRKSAPCGVG